MPPSAWPAPSLMQRLAELLLLFAALVVVWVAAGAAATIALRLWRWVAG